MFSCRFCFFSGVIVLCMSLLCVGSSHTKKCAETDKQALLQLKHGFAGGRHILSSWNGEDCCKWKGISCNNLTGHVTRLDLPILDEYSQALEGKLDSSICELQNLTFLNFSANFLEGYIPKCICSVGQLIELDLSGNAFEGQIPKCIGSLGQLTQLKLAWNKLGGSIPHTLANLSNLENLELGGNSLVANDLEWISHLSNLRYLDLSDVNLFGATDWPSSISKIASLLELNLKGCLLREFNPKSIPHTNSSTSLQILNLSENLLNSSTLLWVLNVSKDLTSLDFSQNYLISVPHGFENMTSLQHLDLSYNELDRSLIKSFQNWCQLKTLSLVSSKLSGQLSDYLPKLCFAQNALEVLHLDFNPTLSGPLPDFSRFSSLKTLSVGKASIFGPLSFDHLPSLENLDLSFNNLSGSLHVFDVTKFASLYYLDLSHNELSGTLPNTIGQLSNLWVLSLSSNKLNGNITEVHLLCLPRLTILDVRENSLSFNMNPNWIPPFQLEQFYASSCILGPQFPNWLKYQRYLRVLQISNTGVIDSIPEWFWDISSHLTYLNVSHNKLSGVLPKSLRSIKTGYKCVWDFRFNNLSGPLPAFPELFAIFLSNNMFSGSVSSFCATSPTDLFYLDLSSNLLAGPLPNCWQKFQSLTVLNLANNSLSGRIPKSFGTLQQIESMHLNNNNFSGEIPSLTLCRGLKFIDFGDNILEGTLPAWVGHNLNSLIVLRLRANKIQGRIPTSLCKISVLQVLDLSTNYITGKIPQCLSQITALSNMEFKRETIFYDTYIRSYYDDTTSPSEVDETILAWKGQNREYGKILGLMTIIDLSGNNLTGEIPQSITTLMALAGLNLSGNNLTGFIPNNIGHMQMLESLDLSRNHLYGRMPTSFSNLSFLSYMNLSFNNLSGKIPISTQLQSFDASMFQGNIGLCGPPLTKQCPSEVVPPTKRVDKNATDEDEDKLINFGFYISLGLGFCVGFWGVCGTLIIQSSWRHAYFQFFNNIKDWIYVRVVVFIIRVEKRFQIQN